MPLYTYRCPQCDKEETAFRSISGRHDGPECCKKMGLVITGTQIAPVLGGGSLDGYNCPVSGEFVTSRKQRREIIAKHNLVEKG